MKMLKIAALTLLLTIGLGAFSSASANPSPAPAPTPCQEPNQANCPQVPVSPPICTGAGCYQWFCSSHLGCTLRFTPRSPFPPPVIEP